MHRFSTHSLQHQTVASLSPMPAQRGRAPGWQVVERCRWEGMSRVEYGEASTCLDHLDVARWMHVVLRLVCGAIAVCSVRRSVTHELFLLLPRRNCLRHRSAECHDWSVHWHSHLHPLHLHLHRLLLRKKNFAHVVVPVAAVNKRTGYRFSSQSLTAQTAQAASCRGTAFVVAFNV